MQPSDTCAALAREVDEPLAGTAPVALGWFGVEVPGAWGRDAIAMSALDDELASHLTQAAAPHPVRLQAIRRPGYHPPASSRRRTVLLAHSGPTPWCEQLDVDDDMLGQLDPGVCARPEPPGIGAPHPGPLVLVCTHGRRDRCCATLGRPVADTLAALHPGLVWEASHVGGHRFAANLVVLPDGLVYGGLDVADAVEATAQHLAGRIDVAHLRGRSGLSRPEQAVEAFARRHLDELRVDGLRLVDVADDDVTVTAIVETPEARFELRVGRAPVGTNRRLSCDSDEPEDPDTFVLLGVARLPGTRDRPA